MKTTTRIAGIASAVAVSTLLTTTASGAIVYDTPVPVTKSNGDFIGGSGIPANGFAVDADVPTGISVALKARGRDSGQALSIVNDVYTVSTGLAADNVSPWWSFDLQWTAGDSVTLAQNYRIVLNVDFNPAANAEQFVSLSSTIPNPPFITTSNPGAGAWSNNLTDVAISDSSHLGFAFWSAFPHTPFDPNAAGEYVIQLLAQDSVGTTIATSEITVVAVPEPAAIGILGLGVGAMLLRRRRWAV
ncbi:MAG: PEP-CTERM sorting domain-containing protein [Tepidisphaeraceae bacterium]